MELTWTLSSGRLVFKWTEGQPLSRTRVPLHWLCPLLVTNYIFLKKDYRPDMFWAPGKIQRRSCFQGACIPLGWQIINTPVSTTVSCCYSSTLKKTNETTIGQSSEEGGKLPWSAQSRSVSWGEGISLEARRRRRPASDNLEEDPSKSVRWNLVGVRARKTGRD